MRALAVVATLLTSAAWGVVSRRGFQPKTDLWLIANTAILVCWWAHLL